MTNAVKRQFLVSFLITQRGNKTDWIQEVLQSGLREGETLDTLCINEIEQEKTLYELFDDYEKEFFNELA